ncbi:hypothetical protein PIB30_063476 [Stylosanthes scabra]|uniref:Uncharacterized protein n=1 Tax=Stylosanthes scabra TaxID=79078 RepID=A0ABU6WJT0_9FABA|nr:hypothetical protein [Stylosanthes scabra]
MRRRLWKRKQEPVTEEPPEDGSSVIKSSENNSVQLLEGSDSANNEFRPMNSEFRLLVLEFILEPPPMLMKACLSTIPDFVRHATDFLELFCEYPQQQFWIPNCRF